MEGDTQIFAEFHFTFPLKPNIAREDQVGNANGAGGREGGSRNGKSSTTLKKELSANFRRACVNSSNRRLLCHRTIRGLSVRPEERGITELLPQGPTSRVCLGVVLPWRECISCLSSLSHSTWAGQ